MRRRRPIRTSSSPSTHLARSLPGASESPSASNASAAQPAGGPSPRCIRRRRIFKPGGYFGRKTQTEPCLHTLFPKWEEARNPLAYLGTRSELENEILRVKVYDWDLKDSDDLIGKADVPLSGVLEYGQVSVRTVARLATPSIPLWRIAATALTRWRSTSRTRRTTSPPRTWRRTRSAFASVLYSPFRRVQVSLYW